MATKLARSGAALMSGAALSGVLSLTAGPAAAVSRPSQPTVAKAAATDTAQAPARRKCRTAVSTIPKRGRVTATICWDGRKFTATGTIRDLSPKDRFRWVGVYAQWNAKVVSTTYRWTNKDQSSTKSWTIKSNPGSRFKFRVALKDAWSRVQYGPWV